MARNISIASALLNWLSLERDMASIVLAQRAARAAGGFGVVGKGMANSRNWIEPRPRRAALVPTAMLFYRPHPHQGDAVSGNFRDIFSGKHAEVFLAPEVADA